MDCKHEIDYVNGAFQCQNASCNQHFSGREIVILTKAQHDLEADVVEAAKDYKIARDIHFNHTEKCEGWDCDMCQDVNQGVSEGYNYLINALTALEKGD